MTKPKVYLTSKRDDWETPALLMPLLENEFGSFDLDAAADPTNAKASSWYAKVDDGLVKPWFGRTYVNPPYSRTVGKWPRKACQEIQRLDGPALIVMLIASRTDTRWWHEYVMPCADEVRFVRGRLTFELHGVPQDAATFPSAILVYRRRTHVLPTGPRFSSMDLRKSVLSFSDAKSVNNDI